MKWINNSKRMMSIISLALSAGIVLYLAAGYINRNKARYNQNNQTKYNNMDSGNNQNSNVETRKTQHKAEDSANSVDPGNDIKKSDDSNKNISSKADEKNSSTNQSSNTENIGVPGHKTVYLTFDDGPSSNTERVLDILKRYNVKATFFVIGSVSEFGIYMYKRIVNEGHAIGNHTFSHKYSKIYNSIDDYITETKKLDKIIFDTTGIKPNIMRFPGGSNNTVNYKYANNFSMKELINRMQNEGYQYFDWNVSSRDMDTPNPKATTMIQSTLNDIFKNNKPSIVLLHDSAQNGTTVEALPEIIKSLQSKGYKFNVLSKSSYYCHFSFK